MVSPDNQTQSFDDDPSRTRDHASSADDSRFYSLLLAWQNDSAKSPEELCPDDPVLLGKLKQAIEQLGRVKGFADAVDESIQVVPEAEPTQFGRYKVIRRLGSGGFGEVWLGFDDILERVVAIKVPRRGLLARPDQIKAYLAEARTVAGLEHPAIVRVYDCGHDAQQCFVVSQYIDGGDLSKWLEKQRAEHAWAAHLVIRMAEALHHAHRSRIVHRDVKPSNILLDGVGTPYLCDFGLAMREEDYGRGSGYAGTPRYMSPEQARGEGHRVDGRSDVYSLGVVLYELLCGRVPFVADSISELLDQIQEREPPPLRLNLESIPRELERITLKAMAKRAADRYATALDFAEDLSLWLDGEKAKTITVSATAPGETPGSVSPNAGETRPPRVVPKSLRAFDANDADFFLRLVPGPRDRDGLPESIRFWKSKIENRDESFSVALVYGPSGCGKTSFIRAGLMPRISNAIHCVYVEATPADTEAKLLNALRKYRADLAKATTLAEMITQLRRQPQGPLLLVIDQFEQWLAAHPNQESSALLQALRQCDGKIVQAVIMVRDDFWMAATRFFSHLEIPLQEGRNSAAVDLFDADHARKVLAGFGKAFGKLPAKRTDYTTAQNQFLNRAVSGLANAEGRIVCVRLALFAEMVKGRPWEPATLDALGGLDGIGATFLEEQLGDAAPPAHRRHQQATRNILKALLPATGVEIKRTLAPKAALLEASGYAEKPAEFAAVIDILDSELRLITPAESEAGGEHYQLTHDYLVPALRDWLTRKQQETRRGRAELLLAERASLWARLPVKRYLPSGWEWLKIKAFTDNKRWTAPERRMMRSKGKRVVISYCVAAVLLGGFVVGGFAVDRFFKQIVLKNESVSLYGQIMTADPYQLAGLAERFEQIRPYAYRHFNSLADRWEGDNSRESLQLKIVRAANDPARLAALISNLEPDDPLRIAGMIILTKRIDDPEVAVALLLIEPEKRLDVLVRKLGELPGAKAAVAKAMAGNQDKPESMAKLRLAALSLTDPDPVLKVIRDNADRTAQARLAAVSKWFPVDLKKLFALYEAEQSAPAKRLLLLMMGHHKEKPSDEMTARLLRDFQQDPHAGLHSTLDWLLRQWNLKPQIAAPPTRSFGWSVTPGGMTLVRFNKPPYEFRMGDKDSDRKADKNVHTREISRGFEIGAKEITVADMIRLKPSYEQVWKRFPRLMISDACPAIVNWGEAAEYCNLLSKAEGIPEEQWCYITERDENGQLRVTVKPEILKLAGYRLPTEGEWEYAARGGAETPRHFGTDSTLLPLFAWHLPNSVNQFHPVGQLFPNEYGLFDTLGNASEWTLTAFDKQYPDYPADGRRIVDSLQLADAVSTDYVHRGGAYFSPPEEVRSARRFAAPPSVVPDGGGFRVARTIPTPAE